MHCLWALLFLLQCVSAYPQRLEATGAVLYSMVFSDWSASFELETGTSVRYELSTSVKAKAEILKTNATVDFSVSVDSLEDYERELVPEIGLMQQCLSYPGCVFKYFTRVASLSAYPLIQNFPFVAGPAVLIYNLPGAPKVAVQPAIVISRANAVGIFNGTIKFWNDTRLVDDQDSQEWKDYLTLTEKPIHVWVRKDNLGTTDILTSAFSSFEPAWREQHGIFNVWPAYFYNGSYTSHSTASSNIAGLAAITASPYSIGYIAYNFAIANAFQEIARMKNLAGNIVSPAEEYLKPTLLGIQLDDNLSAEIVDSRTEYFFMSNSDAAEHNAYPMIGLSYILIQSIQQPTHVCERRRETFKFFKYFLTQRNTSTTTLDGFIPLTPNLSLKVLKKLGEITCNGISLLEIEVQTSYEDSFIVPVAVILGIFGFASFVIFMGLLILLMNPKNKRLPVPMTLFGMNIMFAGMVGYTSVGMWLIIPDNDATCMARVWLGAIAIALMLGGSISRASQIKRLNAALHSISKMEDVIKQRLWMTFRDLLVIIGVQLCILVIWQSVDPFRSVLVITDDTQMTGEYRCASDSLGMWSAEVAFLALVVIFGLIEIYIAWNLPTQTNQSKWILFSLYNTILTGGVCLPIISLVDNERDTAIIAICGLIFLFFQMQISFMVPSFHAGIYLSTHTSSGSNGLSGGGGGRSASKGYSKHPIPSSVAIN